MSEWQGDEMVTRQERRRVRLDKKKERMPQHGRGLARVYKQVIENRADQAPEDTRKRTKGKKP